MKRAPSLLLMMAGCAVALTACGQKGPLFLPDEQRNVAVAPTAPAGTASAPETAAPAAAAPATPAADGAAAPADDTADPQSQRRSNTAPRTN